jgi:hypothetical protein
VDKVKDILALKDLRLAFPRTGRVTGPCHYRSNGIIPQSSHASLVTIAHSPNLNLLPVRYTLQPVDNDCCYQAITLKTPVSGQ